MKTFGKYRATNVRTGEVLEGASFELAPLLKIKSRSLVANYKRALIKNEWKVEKIEKEVVKTTPKEVEKFKQRELKRLNEEIPKLLALWDSYTSGRSDYWTIHRIVEEFNVTQKDIIEVLKKEGKYGQKEKG